MDRCLWCDARSSISHPAAVCGTCRVFAFCGAECRRRAAPYHLPYCRYLAMRLAPEEDPSSLPVAGKARCFGCGEELPRLGVKTCSKCRVLGFHSERCFQKHNVLCRPIRKVLGDGGRRPGVLSDNVFHGTTRSPSNPKGASASSQSSNCSTDAADASRASIGKRRRVCFSFTLTCVSSGGEESDAQERSVKCRSHRKVNSILCDEVDNFSRMEVWVADEKVPAEDLNKTAAEFFAGREDSPVRVRAFQQKVSLS